MMIAGNLKVQKKKPLLNFVVISLIFQVTIVDLLLNHMYLQDPEILKIRSLMGAP